MGVVIISFSLFFLKINHLGDMSPDPVNLLWYVRCKYLYFLLSVSIKLFFILFDSILELSLNFVRKTNYFWGFDLQKCNQRTVTYKLNFELLNRMSKQECMLIGTTKINDFNGISVFFFNIAPVCCQQKLWMEQFNKHYTRKIFHISCDIFLN